MTKKNRDVLKDGGNAVDAAIATLFCVGVTVPQSAGIGGGFFMTMYDPKSQTARCLDARETAPLAATENMFQGNSELTEKGDELTTLDPIRLYNFMVLYFYYKHKGGLLVAVPGELAGYWAAHQAYGRLPWSRLVLPAAQLAADGIKVNRHMASKLALQADLFEAEPSMRYSKEQFPFSLYHG